MRVLAAMSGGVDSAVAAARALDAGHEVVGVHLALNRMAGTLRVGSRGCCTVEDAMDARRVANLLGIPFYVWDFSERFQRDVVDDFVLEYQAGRTPNPCLRCNEKIKFEALLDKAVALGFDAVATGHYALLREGDDGQVRLYRASEEAKDQSYVLAVLRQDQLRHCYFPLGDTSSKALVREEARERGIQIAQKRDSYDICFIPEGDTRGWLRERVPFEPGEIVDAEGNKVGEHEGALGFTVGQRKGLALNRPAVDGAPRYVLRIEPVGNRVVVGSRDDLRVHKISGGRYSLTFAPDFDLGEEFECAVQIRAHADPVPARARLVSVDGSLQSRQRREGATEEFLVTVDEPLRGVAPGQSAVLYLGACVLGQFTIDWCGN